MAPSHMDYNCQSETTVGYTHKKFNSAYTHKKFGKRGKQKDISSAARVATAPLFRPYALSDNTPRKRRLESEQRQLLPPTPPLTPPQQQQPAIYTPDATPKQRNMPAYVSTAPTLNHQAFAYMLQKQRVVLHMRQLLSINPDANTWPVEWRNALYALLYQ